MATHSERHPTPFLFYNVQKPFDHKLIMKQEIIYLNKENLSKEIEYSEAQSNIDDVLGKHTDIRHLFPESGKMILSDYLTMLNKVLSL